MLGYVLIPNYNMTNIDGSLRYLHFVVKLVEYRSGGL